MSVSNEELEKIAYLARLELAKNSIDTTVLQFNKVLDLVHKLEEVDIDGVEPMFSPLEMIQRLRDDIPCDVEDTNLLQNIAPSVYKKLYLVPKVVK